MVETVDGPTMILVEKERYEELIHNEKFLDALFAAGVDNWEGYSVAQNVRDGKDY